MRYLLLLILVLCIKVEAVTSELTLKWWDDTITTVPSYTKVIFIYRTAYNPAVDSGLIFFNTENSKSILSYKLDGPSISKNKDSSLYVLWRKAPKKDTSNPSTENIQVQIKEYTHSHDTISFFTSFEKTYEWRDSSFVRNGYSESLIKLGQTPKLVTLFNDTAVINSSFSTLPIKNTDIHPIEIKTSKITALSYQTRFDPIFSDPEKDYITVSLTQLNKDFLDSVSIFKDVVVENPIKTPTLSTFKASIPALQLDNYSGNYKITINQIHRYDGAGAEPVHAPYVEFYTISNSSSILSHKPLQLKPSKYPLTDLLGRYFKSNTKVSPAWYSIK